MKAIQLSETDNAIGHNDPANRKYFIDGKNVSRNEFDLIKRNAISIEQVNTYQVNGLRHFDSVALLNK